MEIEMTKLHLYGANNFSGVDINGLKDSVYQIAKHRPMRVLSEDDDMPDSRNDQMRNLNKVTAINQKLFDYADKVHDNNLIPLLFAGDHSIAIGSVSASAKHHENLGLIWVDAHADINNEKTSPSGNIHGMPVSFLLGKGDDRLANIGNFKPKIQAENIVYIGLRSVDPGEKDILNQLAIKAYYMEEVQALGIEKILEDSLDYLAKSAAIHLSFDFDVLDPTVFPAVSTPVKNGLNEEQVYAIFKQLASSKKICAIDLVEYNQSRDQNQASLLKAQTLIDFLFDLF